MYSEKINYAVWKLNLRKLNTKDSKVNFEKFPKILKLKCFVALEF